MKKLPFKIPTSRVLKIFIVLFIIYAGYALFKVFWRNIQIDKEIKKLNTEIDQLEAQNQDLKNLITYYKTESYKEKEARRRLGYQKPGEKVVIIVPSQEKVPLEESPPQKEKNNLEVWWNFFFD